MMAYYPWQDRSESAMRFAGSSLGSGAGIIVKCLALLPTAPTSRHSAKPVGGLLRSNEIGAAQLFPAIIFEPMLFVPKYN